MKKSTAVAFTGYRNSKLTRSLDRGESLTELSDKLSQTILKLIDSGYRVFLTGMASGFDMMAAQAVIKAKTLYPDIALIAAIPYPDHHKKLSPVLQESYHSICQQAEKVVYTSEKYYWRAY